MVPVGLLLVRRTGMGTTVRQFNGYLLPLHHTKRPLLLEGYVMQVVATTSATAT
jgi:hypothetical protein